MKLNILNYGILIFSIVIFLYFSSKYIHFTIDDSFIFYRYAENIAEGYYFSWNYDESRAFGFTSYLFTIILGTGIKLGFDVVMFSKFITISSGVLILFLIGKSVKIITEKKFTLYFLSSLPIAFTPAFAFHSIHGMETTFFSSLFLLTVFFYILYYKHNKNKFLFIAVVCSIFCTFTRYEGITITGIFIINQIYQKIQFGNSIHFKQITINFIPILFLCILLIWNYSFFDQFLPNTFYVKESKDITDIVRSTYEIVSFLGFSAPFILLILINLKNNLKNYQTSFCLILVGLGLIPFIFVTQWINPMFRFYIHFLPIIMILSFSSLFFIKEKITFGKFSKLPIFLVILFLVLFNITQNQEARGWADGQSKILETSHIKIGKILGNYPELKNNTLGIIVDAGAVPYYSKWKAFDYTLNDNWTVQNGFSTERFYDFEPKILIINIASHGYPQDSLESLEPSIIQNLSREQEGHLDEIVNHPKFSNFKLITSYPKILIYVEKNFAENNPRLINELIDNSVWLRI